MACIAYLGAHTLCRPAGAFPYSVGGHVASSANVRFWTGSGGVIVRYVGARSPSLAYRLKSKIFFASVSPCLKHRRTPISIGIVADRFAGSTLTIGRRSG